MTTPEFGCAVCPDRHVCQTPCDWLLSRLPKPPTLHRERPYGLWPASTLTRPLRPASNGDLRRYRPLLTPREWTVLELIYTEGLSQRQAAARVRRSRSTVQEWLRRAHAKIARHVIQNRL